MPILASEALLYENKKSPVKNVTPSENRTWASHNPWVQVQHHTFWTDLACAIQEIFKLLFMHHLILDNEPKVSVLEANVNLSLQRRVLDLESEVHDWPGFYLH